ncbi:MAG: hypothetical protein GX823_01330 [Clostridiales bacterium]|nr:hypothetical protein [Clostridiales bacterium]
MRDNEINEQIANVLRDVPAAPPELRHNVMAGINELQYTMKKRKISAFKIVTALAGIAVFAIVIIAVSPLFSRDNVVLQTMSGNTCSGGGALPAQAPPSEKDCGSAEYFACDQNEAITEYAALERGGAESRALGDATGAFIVTGEIPGELEGLEYTLNPDESRLYENVPDEIIEQLLIKYDASIAMVELEGLGNVVKWVP